MDNHYHLLSMYLIKKHKDLKLEHIGDIYKIDYTAVSQSCRRFEREISGNERFGKMLKEVEDVLWLFVKCEDATPNILGVGVSSCTKTFFLHPLCE